MAEDVDLSGVLLDEPAEAGPEILVEGNQVAQVEFLNDLAPGWTCYEGGWGSGKTWAGARKLILLHLLNETPSMVVAHTNDGLSLLCVPELERACEEWGLRYGTHLHGRGKRTKAHMVIEDHPVWLFSAEEPRSITGIEVGAVWGDEAARWPASRSDPLRHALLQVRGRLRHPRAKILHGLFTTTPEGTDTPIARDFSDARTRKPDHRLYVGTTRKNPALTADYVQSLMGAIPAELIDQYLDGKPVSYVANRAHPTFTQAGNVDASLTWYPTLPLHLGCDYNVAPMCWLAGYWNPIAEQLEVVDELVLEDFGQVDRAMREAHARGWGGPTLPDGSFSPRMVVFHPDKSAKARSTVGDSEFATMQRVGRELGWNYGGNAAGVNPPVDARINHLSRLILDATGRRRLRVHPRCVWLIEDLERTARGSSGYDPGAEGKRGHMLDALGYLAWDVVEPMGPISATRFPT